jgi:hypothetical protein
LERGWPFPKRPKNLVKDACTVESTTPLVHPVVLPVSKSSKETNAASDRIFELQTARAEGISDILGAILGLRDGLTEGLPLGVTLGAIEGDKVGSELGASEENSVGRNDGPIDVDGMSEGPVDGEGLFEGVVLKTMLGSLLGARDGASDGRSVGFALE